MLIVKKNNNQPLIMVAMVLIPCLVLGYFIFYENIKTRIEDEKNKNIELAKVTAQSLDTYIRGIKYTLKNFSNLDRVMTNKDDIRQILINLKLKDDVEKYFILNRNGEEVVVYPQSKIPIKISDKYLKQAAMKSDVVELLNPGTDPIRVVVIAPIIDRHRKIIGFAGAVISMEKVARDFANIKVSNNGYVIMTDKIGQVLVHPNANLLRQRVPPKKMKTDPIYLASSRGVPGAIEIKAPFDGKKKLFSFAPVKETGWIVLLVEPENDLQVLITDNLTRNSVIFLLILFLVLFLYLYFKLLFERIAKEEAIRSEKLDLISQLAAGMAHEIHNPLTAVKGFLQILMNEETDDKKKKKQDVMMTEVEKIEGIIKETMLLAKPQKQKRMEFSLDGLLSRIVMDLSPQISLKNIIFNVMGSSEPLIVWGDYDHTKQALLNVIRNAIDATSDGGVVVIETFKKGLMAVIQVIDKGYGIPPKDMKKVGTPFFTTKDTGVGLSLTVSNRIVEDMGGKVEIYSELGQGTRVVVSLPLVVK